MSFNKLLGFILQSNLWFCLIVELSLIMLKSRLLLMKSCQNCVSNCKWPMNLKLNMIVV